MKIKRGTWSHSLLFLNLQAFSLYPPGLEKACERSWTWTAVDFAAYRRERHRRFRTKGCGPISYATQVTLSAHSVRSKQKWEIKGKEKRRVLKLEEEDPVPLGAHKSFREKLNPTLEEVFGRHMITQDWPTWKWVGTDSSTYVPRIPRTPSGGRGQ